MLVVDASCVLEVLLRTPAAGKIEDRILSGGESLAAPHLIDIEIAQVLRRYALREEIDEARGREALADLVDLPLERYPHDPILPRVWSLRATITAYDAAYVALAEVLGAPLLTRDRRLAGAPGNDAVIEVL